MSHSSDFSYQNCECISCNSEFTSQFWLVFTILHLSLAILKQFSQKWKKKVQIVRWKVKVKNYLFYVYSVVETSFHNIVIIFCANGLLDESLRIIKKTFIWPRWERWEHAHDPDRALCVHGARTTEDRERAGGRYELALSGCVWPLLYFESLHTSCVLSWQTN